VEKIMSQRFNPQLKAGVAALLMLSAGSAVAASQINALFMTQAAYSENDIRAMTQNFQKQHPDVSVNLEFVPYEALHDKIVAARGAGGNGYDVVLFDAIWPAEFTRFDLLQDVSARITPEEKDKVFPGAMNTVIYKGKTLGMPWILDTKYLYYNKAMLSKAGITTPPQTWQQVLDDAKIIKQKKIVNYPLVWSWSQAEALVCDYTTLVSGFGGQFYQNGKLNFSSPASLKALNLMKSSLDDGLSNPASREYLEEDVRKSFSNGDAAFALNWTYMYNMANDPKQSKVAGDVGIMPAPGDAPGQAGGVNGSMGLGIAKGSTHPEQAWQYIQYMTSQPVQNQYARLSLPIWKSSYQDPAVQKDQESLIAAADKSLNVMLSRPETADYSRLSNQLQQQLQQVLLGKTTAQDAMAAVDKSAARLR
jgi:multiple sugar transport system substrate-binding protein